MKGVLGVRFGVSTSAMMIAALAGSPVYAQATIAAAPAPQTSESATRPTTVEQAVVSPDAAATTADAADTGQEVVVQGYRASVAKAINLKRNSDVMMDAISADDIASFPEANIAESLQRIPGISIDRDNGEGKSISVRGLGSGPVKSLAGSAMD